MKIAIVIAAFLSLQTISASAGTFQCKLECEIPVADGNGLINNEIHTLTSGNHPTRDIAQREVVSICTNANAGKVISQIECTQK